MMEKMSTGLRQSPVGKGGKKNRDQKNVKINLK